MRWALITKAKDEIAPLLVQWIETQNHQYGKRIRTIFRDGGSEFFRIRDYCNHHGIRIEISAPDTPEQNGVAESSNKIILRNARSMLIDAGMPASFWPWAVQHACFITNRLYCLRTKKVPLIDFLKSLSQPHADQIDFTNLPRFGCRAYKLIHPKHGNFEPRASKGWFLGFQQGTSKNFIIFHPQQTSSQRSRWVLSITPHVTFNEDVMFGDKSEQESLQQSKNPAHPMPVFLSPTDLTTVPLTVNSQTDSQLEGEYQPPSSEDITIEQPLSEDITIEPPTSESIITSPEIEPTHSVTIESNLPFSRDVYCR